jgi:hypothetical protein
MLLEHEHFALRLSSSCFDSADSVTSAMVTSLKNQKKTSRLRALFAIPVNKVNSTIGRMHPSSLKKNRYHSKQKWCKSQGRKAQAPCKESLDLARPCVGPDRSAAVTAAAEHQKERDEGRRRQPEVEAVAVEHRLQVKKRHLGDQRRFGEDLVCSVMFPRGSTKPLIPVLAERTRARLFSTARNTAMAMD